MNDRLFSLDDIEVSYPNDFYISCHEDGHKTAVFLSEATDDKYNAAMRKFLFRERIKTDKDILARYKEIKERYPDIKYAFLKPEQYKKQNVIVDLSYYHKVFMQNNIYKNGDRGVKMYFDFLCRIFEAKEIKDQGYTRYTIFIPIDKDGIGMENPAAVVDIFDYKTTINFYSVILRMIKTNPVKLKEKFSKYDFVFMGKKGYFKVDFNTFELKDQFRFVNNINTLLNPNVAIIEEDPEADIKKDSPKAILHTVVDKIEDTQNIQINDIRGSNGKEPSVDPYITKANDTNEVIASPTKINNITVQAAPVAVDKAKETVVDIIKDSIKDTKASTADDVIDGIDNTNSDYITSIIAAIADEENNSVKTSTVRSARLDSLKQNFDDKEVHGKKLREILDNPTGDKPIPKAPIKTDSINKEEWESMQFNNFNKVYNLDSDIMSILGCFNDPRKSVRVGVLDVNVEDTSTSEDYVVTYIVHMEDEFGKRFTLKFDIPKIVNNRFMRLRGNQKAISGQLALLPTIKTDEDTVQMRSDYNKVFIRRYGSVAGKTYLWADKLIKVLNKNTFEGITVNTGDHTLTCKKYELPIDYIDMAGVFSSIDTPRITYIFDQEIFDTKYKADRTLGIPYAYDKEKDEIIYYDYNSNIPISTTIANSLLYSSGKPNKDNIIRHEELEKALLNCKPSNKYTYSKASILNNEVPVIVLLGYGLGLCKAMELAGIRYHLSETKKDISVDYDTIKFNDGYVIFENTMVSSMLMNGIKECDTENYSLMDLNSKAMWLDFLDQFGGRILADGLDNYADLMVDPITAEVCHKYGIPDTYYEQLVYSNALLVDNKYNRHVDITGNRYRSNEIIAGYTYKVLAKAYGDYKTKMKRSRQESTMSVKQSAVIDAILLDPTASDLSILNPLLEMETANNVTFKGLAGMNSDRSYGLDKRTYDDSMVNLLALSTGFAANVGINRVATIDMNVEGTRGYIKQTKDTDDKSITKTFSMTEALNPFGVTRDDPFRSAMTYIQTAKHGMITNIASPQLITNGADEALPYMASDVFAFKAKQAGKVIELEENDHMILEYKDGTKDYVDLRERVMKNSDGGFYVTIMLVPKIELNKKFKQGDIVAYHNKSFSNKVGPDDNTIAYNIGTMAKVAIMNTDEGFEDSTIVSDWVSEAMSSEVVVLRDCTLPKNTNLYYMVKKGQYVQEGEPLLVFQNAFDDKDINILLKNITDDDGTVSELGRIPIKSKVTGIIQDINIYRTVEKDELSDSLRKVVDAYEKDITARKKLLKSNGISDTGFVEPAQTLEPTGKLKNAKDSVYIEIYIKYNDKLSVGDKIVATSAAKGVVKDIFPKGEEPTTDFRPNEAIHAMFANGSFNARMIASVLNQGAINKGLIELSRKVKDIMDIPYDDSTIY